MALIKNKLLIELDELRDLIRQEIDKKSDLQKSWDRNRIKQLKSK